MKVLAVNGSPRRQGNTAILIDEVLARLENAGIETAQVSLADYRLAGCGGCGGCAALVEPACTQEDDGLNDLVARMIAADGIVLGSPVYFSDVTTNMKSLIDRAGYISVVSGGVLRRKVGAAVAAVRRAGALHTLDTMNHFFQCSEMVSVGSSYWNLAVGQQSGEVRDDAEGMATMRTLGDSMAWLLHRIDGCGGE
jgi:multimeric flavodoxin WrbA